MRATAAAVVATAEVVEGIRVVDAVVEVFEVSDGVTVVLPIVAVPGGADEAPVVVGCPEAGTRSKNQIVKKIPMRVLRGGIIGGKKSSLERKNKERSKRRSGEAKMRRR